MVAEDAVDETDAAEADRGGCGVDSSSGGYGRRGRVL